jgi:uncharacterized protein YecT (DUF1311 family)
MNITAVRRAVVSLVMVVAAISGARAQPAPPLPAPRGVLLTWSTAKDGVSTRYDAGPLRLTWSATQAMAGLAAPTLSIEGPGAARFRFTAPAGSSLAAASFGWGLIDPQGGPTQILISTYTGGAHCCNQLDLLEEKGGVWSHVAIGSWNGGPLTQFPTDVDGDTIPDLVMTDDRFLYLFASYAGSRAPPQIFNVIDGKVVDVSRAPRYRTVFQADMDSAKQGCLQHDNGACAAFVADGWRLGVNDWAWPIMMANFDPSSTWFYTRCAVATGNGACPAGQEQKPINFPQSLAWFLTDTGYSGPAYPLAPIALGDAPSFDCARATTPVLQLICKTPSLARRDRMLLRVYARALRAASDKEVLREAQRGWIRTRDAAPADVRALTRVYDARIRALGGSPEASGGR